MNFKYQAKRRKPKTPEKLFLDGQKDNMESKLKSDQGIYEQSLSFM